MAGSGFDARRTFLKAGMAVLTMAVATPPSRAEEEEDEDYQQPKLDRTFVHYQNAPGPDNHMCGLCTNFLTPNMCRVVDGTVIPTGYCLSFAPKDAEF